MNDFQVYEQLCDMSKIASRYNDGKKISEKIRECADRFASQLYRVAVIGVFKVGKSSMINALLGTEVLPTEVLPMTAVNTRVIYGEERKIIIRYKNGREEEATIEQLVNYATKYDEQKRLKASTINEILVYYPSPFCKNHIEIIDTPGMNDNEEMTAVTQSVLGNIDAAVMVISALQPLSMTEQNLIISMLIEQQIHHIVFVVTHIDALSEDEDEKDDMIDYIKNRIKKDLLKRALNKFEGNDNLTKKAHRILDEPNVFGVSSKQAIDGFVYDSEEMLRLSRFPHFKKELLTLLTAAQSTDIRLNAKDYIRELNVNIEKWKANECKYLNTEIKELLNYKEQFSRYFADGLKPYNKLMSEMRKKIMENDFYKEQNLKRLIDTIKMIFVNNLYTIKVNDNTDSKIHAVLKYAVNDAEAIIKQKCEMINKMIDAQMQETYDSVVNLRPFYYPFKNEISYPAMLSNNIEIWKKNNIFPKFDWIISPIPELDTLVNINIMPHIESVIINSIKKYGELINKYIASWELIMTEYIEMIIKENEVIHFISSQLKQNESRQTLIELNHKNNVEALKSIKEQLS